jgi:hypothetical protein
MIKDILGRSVAFSALGVGTIEGEAIVKASWFIFAEGSFPNVLELVDFAFVDLEVRFYADTGVIQGRSITNVLISPLQVIKLSS